jgi:hypothetical protein
MGILDRNTFMTTRAINKKTRMSDALKPQNTSALWGRTSPYPIATACSSCVRQDAFVHDKVEYSYHGTCEICSKEIHFCKRKDSSFGDGSHGTGGGSSNQGDGDASKGDSESGGEKEDAMRSPILQLSGAPPISKSPRQPWTALADVDIGDGSAEGGEGNSVYLLRCVPYHGFKKHTDRSNTVDPHGIASFRLTMLESAHRQIKYCGSARRASLDVLYLILHSDRSNTVDPHSLTLSKAHIIGKGWKMHTDRSNTVNPHGFALFSLTMVNLLTVLPCFH